MTSRLAQMQARFQQKQMQEKEEKLLKLYENQQQRTIERVSRGSAGSEGSVTTILSSPQGGKVRQMFDERRQKAGIDRSYPLEPLKTTTRSNGLLKPASRNIVKTQTLKVKTSVIGNVENYRYEDSNANDILYDKRDNLVNLMNDHNLNESLDDEQLPNLGIDEVDEPAFTGKLANVGGKLPSQSERKAGTRNPKILTTTFKKDTKPTVVKKSKTSPKPASPAGISSQSPKTSAPATPSKSDMSTKKSNPLSGRTPSTQRPSARALKGPHSAVVAKDDLEACHFCNRRFASDRLQVHEEICVRTAKKKRKAYDALKHRVQGTELEPFVRRSKGVPKIPASQPEVIIVSKAKQGRPASAGKKNNWRQTHEDFISTIRAAKMAQQHVAKGGKLTDLPPPPPSTNPDYVQCPHCGRRFNQGAAERHIPKCATFQFNKPKNGPKAAAVRGKGSYR